MVLDMDEIVMSHLPHSEMREFFFFAWKKWLAVTHQSSSGSFLLVSPLKMPRSQDRWHLYAANHTITPSIPEKWPHATIEAPLQNGQHKFGGIWHRLLMNLGYVFSHRGSRSCVPVGFACPCCIDGFIHDNLLSLPFDFTLWKTCLLWHKTFLSSCLSWHFLIYCYDLLQIHCCTCYSIAYTIPCNHPFPPGGKGFFCTPACYWDSLPDMDFFVTGELTKMIFRLYSYTIFQVPSRWNQEREKYQKITVEFAWEWSLWKPSPLKTSGINTCQFICMSTISVHGNEFWVGDQGG